MVWLSNFKNLIKAIKDPIWAILFLLWIKRYFSQTWEELILEWFTKKNDWVYIDIWANHPINWNNTYWFYRKWWRWINIEPNKSLIKKFLSKRSLDHNLQLWVWKSNWELTFYIFNEDQMSTCDVETANRYLKAWYKIIDKYSVPIWTLEKICDTYIKNKTIDILSIDVEGWDMDVLESNNWEKYKPNYIILETVEYAINWVNTWEKQNHIFDPYLLNKWYSVIAETWINTIYKLK